jgi:hypothetical protein
MALGGGEWGMRRGQGAEREKMKRKGGRYNNLMLITFNAD